MNRCTRWAGLAVVTFGVLACSPDDQSAGPADTEGHHDHAAMQMPAGDAVTGHSLYQLDSTWTNQRGESMQLDAFAGRPVVLAMVYTHCDFACPRIIADMRTIRGKLGDRSDEVEFVLVSIDPERDTVERLREFGEETGLTKQGWTLLRGDHADVRELAAVFGVQYRQTTETDFAHSNVLNVLSPNGEIAHQQKGLGVDSSATVTALREALARAS